MFAVTDNDSWEEWSGKIYPADPAYYNFTIKGASKEKYKIVVDGMTTYQFINVDGGGLQRSLAGSGRQGVDLLDPVSYTHLL